MGCLDYLLRKGIGVDSYAVSREVFRCFNGFLVEGWVTALWIGAGDGDHDWEGGLLQGRNRSRSSEIIGTEVFQGYYAWPSKFWEMNDVTVAFIIVGGFDENR